MIVFVYGTTAEAIKLAPIARRLDEKGIKYMQWVTMQHTHALRAILPGLGLPEPDMVIANGVKGEPLRRSGDVIPWALSALRWLGRNRRSLRRSLPENTILLVHGDTMTTVIGAWIARRIHRPSAHVEAGLRSGDWRHPFPEELDRRIVGRLAAVHYAPSPEAVTNLAGVNDVVFTHGNTVLDAVLDHVEGDGQPEAPYGIVLLHRFEYMGNRQLVEETMRAIAEHAPFDVRFFVDEFAKGGLADILPTADLSHIQVQDKLPHAEFVDVLRKAEFVITDSGGIQEECALLGIPTLVHRKATERLEGIGRNVVLSDWKISKLADFLRNYAQHRRQVLRPDRSPSDLIVEDLIARGFGTR
jgi:UDP-N-acetylglucosamine 2-epimerase (non-hydrolysing)